MTKKSQAYYRFCHDMSQGKFSYYEPEEIQDAVMDLMDDGNREDALLLAEEGKKQHPDDEEMDKLVIWMYIHNNRTEEAASLFEKYRNDNQDSSLCLKFSLEVLKGDPDKALKTFFTSLKDGAVGPTEWLNTIDEMFETIPSHLLPKWLAKAVPFVKKAEEMGRIGGFLMDCCQFKQAADVLEKALDIDAYDIYSWQDLARCYMELKEDDRSLEACTYGLAINDQNPLLHFISGYICSNKNDYKQSIEHLEMVRQYAEGKMQSKMFSLPKDELYQQISVAYSLLGHAYIETEQFEKARECYECLYLREPANMEAILQLVTVEMMIGDSPKAAEYIIQALERNPKDSIVLSMYVSIMTTMHRFDEALEGLRNLIRIKPRSHNYQLAYAELLLHCKKTEEADKAFRKLLASKPRQGTVLEALTIYFESIDDNAALQQINELKK